MTRPALTASVSAGLMAPARGLTKVSAGSTITSGKPKTPPLNPEQDRTLHGLHGEIIRAFDFFNARFWAKKPLPICAFSFYPQLPNSRRLGHYFADSWADGGGDARKLPSFAEIIFYADSCLRAGMQQVVQTLLHEMVHHWQCLHGKPGKGNFHNREWHAEAARVGLKTEGPKGFTTPEPEFLAAYTALAPRTELIPFRNAQRNRVKGKMKKWTCGGCFKPDGITELYSIRAGKAEINIKCLDCGNRFVCEED